MSRKSVQWELSSNMYMGTDMTKQMVTSHNFADAPKNEKYLDHPTHYGVSYLLLFSDTWNMPLIIFLFYNT
jgi:hypothetical protein